jgi:hypothetical protein
LTPTISEALYPLRNNAANPNNMSEMKYSMGDLGGGRNSVGTRIMWSSAGGAAGNLDGVNTHMTNYYGLDQQRLGRTRPEPQLRTQCILQKDRDCFDIPLLQSLLLA